ncbi:MULTISPECIES: M28 family peptidase [unclassified Sphingobium]|uniref:M28 family peptidase n=1 Tax=unclassified Sphingobium TaxID=2611147 RepID=UPI0035A5C0CB
MIFFPASLLAVMSTLSSGDKAVAGGESVLSPRRLRLAIIAGILLLISALPASLLWMTAVPGRSYQGTLPRISPAQAATAARLKADITIIARKAHNAAHLREMETVASHLETGLRLAGYAPRRQPIAGVPGTFNIDATLDSNSPAAPTLVIDGHYDSYDATPGANDNGSGAASTLELARMLADLRGTSKLRLRFVLFANEEPPHFQTDDMGSLVYARSLAATGEKMIGMISLETLGYYSDARGSQQYPFPLSLLYPDTGNFVAFVGTTGARGFVRSTVAAFRQQASFPSVGGSAPAFIQGIDWSDHWAFDKVGVPALMVTDTAPFRYPYYHTQGDTPDRIDYVRLARVVNGLERVLRRWALDGQLSE